jgi:hypothetical protein
MRDLPRVRAVGRDSEKEEGEEAMAMRRETCPRTSG